MSERMPNDPWSLLQEVALEDLQQTSDEELLQEATADGEDLEAGLAALKRHARRQAEQARLRTEQPHDPVLSREVISLMSHLRSAGEVHVDLTIGRGGHGKTRGLAELCVALAAEEQALAAKMLMKLSDSSRARCRSDLPFDCDAQGPARRDQRAELIKHLLLQLVEHWIRLRMDESAELADPLPESTVWILRPLLRNAVADPQILKFASISLGKLVSRLCTSALAKASGLDFDSNRGSEDRDELLRRVRARAEWRAFHNLNDSEPRLVTDCVDPPRAISALATMQRALAAYNPDAIVAVAGGGKIVGDFLRKQIGVNAHRYFVASRENGRYVLDRAFPRCGSIKRVVIIDDISRTGCTLTSVRDEIFGDRDDIEFKALALVSAAAAIDRIKDFFLLLPVVAQSSNVSVPWDTKGSYRATEKFYFFGGDHGELEVPRKLYEQTYGEVGT